ncbi:MULTISPECIES: tRNA lysidine(34) synthetase TilS [unclassified Corynebacterium]|uniref:tRNA lysidine(34) synthetase TilS n=1 Tax=unclassified Corynebacterium TaxID=2624378 RepID=UPI0035269897
MPPRIGDVPLPRICPRFLTLRVAVRRFARGGGPAVLGVSGGPDSLMLAAAALAEDVAVHAVCVDHGLQPGSGAQASRAAEQSRSMGATAEVVAVDPAAFAGSLESAARDARYSALAEVARRISAPVWVGHTLDDSAETMVLAALRGISGGLSEEGTVPGTAGTNAPVSLLRPFLRVRRADTVGAAQELGLTPWQDPHNADQGFRRVSVRGRIIPALSEMIGGDAVPPLAEASAKATEDAELLDALAADALRRHRDHSGCTTPGSLPVSVGGEHPALRRRILAHFLRANGAVVTARGIAGVDTLLTDWHGQGPVAVGGTSDGRRLVVMRHNGILTVSAR